jgi:hypothetical protein
MSTQDATITLSTSDETPALLKISRAALITHSRVFADMVSLSDLKSESVDGSIPVSESEKELNVLLMVIGEPEESRDKVLKSFGSDEWKTLAELADKYHCWTLEKIVEAKAWLVKFAVYFADAGRLTVRYHR